MSLLGWAAVLALVASVIVLMWMDSATLMDDVRDDFDDFV